MGVLPGHVPTIAELQPGLLTVFEGAEEKKFFVSSGFAFIHSNSVLDVVAVEDLSHQRHCCRGLSPSFPCIRNPGSCVPSFPYSTVPVWPSTSYPVSTKRYAVLNPKFIYLSHPSSLLPLLVERRNSAVLMWHRGLKRKAGSAKSKATHATRYGFCNRRIIVFSIQR